jgi:Family of unknown function (DUF6252)
MKYLIRNNCFIPYFLVLAILIQCKKGNDKNGLPPETQVGNNTFGCLVNGKVFTPKGGGLSPNYSCYYQQIYPGNTGFYFHVSGSDLNNSSFAYNVNINCDSVKISENQSYTLSNAKKGNSVGAYLIVSIAKNNEYATNVALTGQLIVKKFDEINHIASGTFWFNAVNTLGDTVKITDGRFDMKYTQ